MKVIKFAPGLIPVLKHGTHDQKSHGNWAHGSSYGDFTLEEGADSTKLATYSHPNGTRVIFQNLSKVESSSPMVKETLETIDGLSKKYPVPNLTFVVQSGEGGGIVARGHDGIAYSPANTDEPERIQAWLDYKKMPPATDPNAPYIAIRQRVIAPDSMPKVTYVGAGGFIRPEKTQEQKTAYLKEIITHEWGHALDKRSQAVSDAQFRNRDNTSTSNYGNKNGREFFAETFAAFELGGLVKDRPDNIPNYKKASEYLEMDSLKGKVSKESFEGFVVYENFETEEPLLIEGGTPLDFDEPFAKHQDHDQSSHGNWAEGSEGSSSELSNDSIRDIISGSDTVNEMYQKVAERLGKSMKPKLEDLSEEEINFFRGVTDVNIQAQSLLDGEIRFTPFQTWGQGIYISSEPEYAQTYGELIGLKLDKSAKLVEGEIAWAKAYSLFDKETSLDMPKILDRITSGKMDNFSDSDIANIYWAAKGYDGYSVYKYGRAEVVLFNADKLTVNKADIGEAVRKHKEHDQSSHGNWADGAFDEETEAEDAQNEYFDRYGFEPLTGDPAGTTREEIDALGYYATAGYRNINEGLREGWKNENDAPRIANLDTLIENSPDIFGDKTLYRVINDEVIADLQPGDIFIDKGYTSTTRVDITKDENISVKQDLLNISDKNNTVVAILPNERKNGKGLAVDMYANATDGVTRTNGVLTASAEREKEVLLPRSTALKFIGMENKVAVFQRVDQ
jgi:hypothetical protein